MQHLFYFNICYANGIFFLFIACHRYGVISFSSTMLSFSISSPPYVLCMKCTHIINEHHTNANHHSLNAIVIEGQNKFIFKLYIYTYIYVYIYILSSNEEKEKKTTIVTVHFRQAYICNWVHLH
jgi:hypothetical protein